MGRPGSRPRHRRAGWLPAALLVAVVLGGSVTGASGKLLPTAPTCGRFSQRKVGNVLAVGSRMYLDHTLVHGTECTYEGLTAKQSALLANKNVPYQQIKYYPTLMIDIQTTTLTLFDFQKNLLGKSGFPIDSTSPRDRWRIGGQEFFSSGEVTGNKMPPCGSMILYNNWVGPPDCMGQPALREVAVLAWIPMSGGLGRMVYLSAGAQDGSPLSVGHMLELAKESVTGALY